MDETRLDQRIIEAFAADKDLAFAPKYVDALLANLRDLAAAIRRSTLLLVLTVVAFFLLRDARQVAITLGPFKIEQADAVVALLPAIGGFLLYEAFSSFAAMSDYGVLLRRVVAHLHPKLSENELAFGLLPTTSTVLHRSPRTAFTGKSDYSRDLAFWLAFAMPVSVLVGGFVFLVFACWTLLGDGMSALEAISCAFVLLMMCRIAVEIREEAPRDDGADAA